MFSIAIATAFALQAGQSAAEILPAPTGPNRTGRMVFHWKDTRDELETRAEGDKRELMVYLFYPADASASGARAEYAPDADAMRPPWTESQVATMRAMRAYSRENAALARGTARYPAIVFQPGGGMKPATYHALLEDLASHGYVVAAIDPPYNARAVRLLDGRVLGGLAPADRGWPQPRNADENQRFYTERVVHLARDMSFVIDKLAELDRGRGPFANRLDMARGVGALGHSRGGRAAGTVRALDPRIRGGVNLDGAAGDRAIQLPPGTASAGSAPFLWIQKALPPPPSAEQLQRAGRTIAEFHAEIARVTGGWDRQMEGVAGGAMRVHMERPGIEHIDFSDEPFWDGNMTAASRPGRVQTLSETRVWLKAFFDGTLRGNWSDLKALAARPQPQVTVKQFGTMWP